MAGVLCTNGLLSKTLAVVRSMGRMGIRTVVADKTRLHASGFSKYADKTLVYPDPKRHQDAFYEWLRETIVREKCDFLFPMDDDVMDIVVANQDELSKLCHIPVPSKEAYAIAADKSRTMRLALRQSVPHPTTVEPNFAGEIDQEELLKLTSGLRYPLVIKPRQSSGSRGIRFAEAPNQLIQLFCAIHSEYPNPMIQEAIPYGGKYGVCLGFDAAHRLKASFVYKQLRNFPHERGPSIVRESIRHQELLEYSLKLMEGIPWYGVVEVEYIIDARDRTPCLMEINPRYWASLHLAIECGIDFPRMQYEAGMGLDPELMISYATGVKGRQLLPGDLLYFLTNRNRWKMDPPFFTTKLHDDILSRHDIGPFFGFLFSALRYSLDSKMWKFIIKR